jgi:hypothetical protein
VHGWRSLLAAGPEKQEEGLRMKYEKPVVQRFGTLREITLGGGPLNGGDATDIFHRS